MLPNARNRFYIEANSKHGTHGQNLVHGKESSGTFVDTSAEPPKRPMPRLLQAFGATEAASIELVDCRTPSTRIEMIALVRHEHKTPLPEEIAAVQHRVLDRDPSSRAGGIVSQTLIQDRTENRHFSNRANVDFSNGITFGCSSNAHERHHGLSYLGQDGAIREDVIQGPERGRDGVCENRMRIANLKAGFVVEGYVVAVDHFGGGLNVVGCCLGRAACKVLLESGDKRFATLICSRTGPLGDWEGKKIHCSVPEFPGVLSTTVC